MTGRADDAGSSGRSHLRLVSSNGSEPVVDDELPPGLIVDGGSLPGYFGDEVLEVDLGDEAEIDLEFLLVPLLTEAERQMRSIRRPLDAEMWASELLGMLELGAPDERTPEEREAVTLNLAIRLAEHAIDQDSLSGLAMLRTLSVIGPPESRELARNAATRMSEGGFRDRVWVSVLSRPDVERCWGFRDQEGSQESVTVVFRYGKRQHTLTVLIDHDLGGGVKDCWISEDPDAVLAETRAALESEGIEVEVLPMEQARDTLQAALTHPECPATPDEIEDIAMTRALLRARVELLTNGPAHWSSD